MNGQPRTKFISFIKHVNIFPEGINFVSLGSNVQCAPKGVGFVSPARDAHSGLCIISVHNSQNDSPNVMWSESSNVYGCAFQAGFFG